MALEDIEQAAQYQALCANAFRDGGFRHAHNLRAVSRSMNQAVLEGEPILSLSFDKRAADGDGNPGRSARAVASPYWERLTPGVHIIDKMPKLDRAEIFINAVITDGARVRVQLETLSGALDFSGSGAAGRTFELIGTGVPKLYSFTDVPVHSGVFERFGFWVRGDRTETEGDTAAHGSPNKGRISFINPDGQAAATDSVAVLNWNYGPGVDSWAIDHLLVVHDGPDESTIGHEIFSAQITSVDDVRNATILGVPAAQGWFHVFRPPLPRFADSLQNKFFIIYELPKIRIYGIDIYTQDLLL